jgi:hypothetical protein
LDSFEAVERKRALATLCEQVEAGRIDLPQTGTDVNIHCHTFFSYNTYGYSPSKFAWLARKAGLAVAGVVDFDVLDALDEFLDAARLLGLKGCAGLETRVYVPEFSTRVINSPGEPGISYHMGVGFPNAKLYGRQREFLLGLRRTAQQRNRELMGRVNEYLRPLELDYERDVLVLTPSGNATERHICLAYARKAAELFGEGPRTNLLPCWAGGPGGAHTSSRATGSATAGRLVRGLQGFWAEKLGVDVELSWLPESRGILDTIRAKTMKRGGVGYVQPGKGSFPWMADMNRFILTAGAIPVHTWLDGTSDGEKDIEELLEVAMSTGAAAINVIPDRNYTPGAGSQKLENLYAVVELAEKLHLPVVMGTEMNSPGQKFVDDLDTDELRPLAPVFLKGAHIVYAHSVLQQRCGFGYTSEWAAKSFDDVESKNKFFEELGSSLHPKQEDKLNGLGEQNSPQEILRR